MYRVGAIILAAGASRRMGRSKAMLPIDGRAMLTRVVEQFTLANVDPIIVVTGQDRELSEIAPAARFVHNPDHQLGEMLSSVKVGIATISREVDAFFIAPCDQPFIRVETIRNLAAQLSDAHDVIRPVFRGEHGHPILIASRCADRILSLPKDATLKTFVRDARTRVLDLAVDDEFTITDIDTPQDYRDALARFAQSRATDTIGADACQTAQA